MHLPHRNRQQGIAQAVVLGAIAAAAIAAWLLWPAKKEPRQITPEQAPPATAVAPADTPKQAPPATEAAPPPQDTGRASVSTSQIKMRP